jgi:ElaB/YqjD/DUF883 family membrane-anchored ribosome-binding protein
MQALAAGTAVAVPAFKMIRSVPLPWLMIGAGLALASPKVRNMVAEKASAGLKTEDGGNVIDEAKDKARDTWQSAKTRAETRIDEARSAVNATVAETRDTAAQLAEDARKRVTELGGTVRDNLTSASASLGSTLSAATETAKDTLDTTQTKIVDAFQTTRTSTENMVRDNAVLVGGLGLAIGALIAASLPSTRGERETIGPASDALRKTAANAASETFDDVKKAAMSATDRAAEKISEADIGSKMSQATEEATEKLKTVADDAITTAFEPSQTEHR